MRLGRLWDLELLPEQLEVDRHRVEWVLDLMRDPRQDPPERCELARCLHGWPNGIGRGGGRRFGRSVCRGVLLDAGRQPPADGLERLLHVRERPIRRQFETNIVFAAAQAAQSGPNHVNRCQDPVGQDQGDEEGCGQRPGHGDRRRTKGPLQLIADERGREAYSDCTEWRITEAQWLGDFQHGVLVDLTKLDQRVVLEKRGQVHAGRLRQAFQGRRTVGDRDARGVDDHGVGDVAAVGDARLEGGPDARVPPNGRMGIEGPGDDPLRLLKQRTGQQLTPGGALVQSYPHQRREVQRPEGEHRAGDERHHRGDLSSSDAEHRAFRIRRPERRPARPSFPPRISGACCRASSG